MSKQHIFNGHESWMLREGLKLFIAGAEAEIAEATADGKNPIFATGYFEMVGKELQEKVTKLTKLEK